jgi:hypothetical protein
MDKEKQFYRVEKLLLIAENIYNILPSAESELLHNRLIIEGKRIMDVAGDILSELKESVEEEAHPEPLPTELVKSSESKVF